MNCSGNTCNITTIPLDANFWNERWISQETGWDIQSVSPPLKNYIDTITNKNAAILIPGCGNAYEAQYLLENGFANITVIDISAQLCQKIISQFEQYIGKQLTIICGDFFNHYGKYDYILEQTFFCALNPTLRKNYVAHMHQLLNTNGKLAGVLFNTSFPNVDLPPFGGNKEEYIDLFQNQFQIKHMENCYNSIEPRKDKELFVELIKK
ncbi:MAG: methyltransferase [Chitinophagales bacterium]|nr:methyltransferase [Chitinophagales bacterium]